MSLIPAALVRMVNVLLHAPQCQDSFDSRCCKWTSEFPHRFWYQTLSTIASKSLFASCASPAASRIAFAVTLQGALCTFQWFLWHSMEQYHAALHAEHVFNLDLEDSNNTNRPVGSTCSSSPSITYVGDCFMRVVDPSRPPSFTCCTYLHEKSDEAKVLSSELKEE